ncbi:MAG: hypothetical protein GY734_22025 [Herbaspirillum sp.]|uniref:hypothetical protein n=1 Tax=Herbaspirillum sp. TaxID=1890675 RepID=UPI0025909ED6|nr:hypothetical protein [Herbaspirillum sp.]MCP3658544.1 hypothetical protein [Herbaspirillum sp.]MCP3947113.1 hypothetical protein [Herbaspirillum sp.]MCP4033897.1 hypothetical protein [Herbaspirillum sp.]MCP4555930.1 hypothetical protein [Herbaspirillum sp.]
MLGKARHSSRAAGLHHSPNWVGPKLGEHTDEVLASVGIGADELKRMRSFGII